MRRRTHHARALSVLAITLVACLCPSSPRRAAVPPPELPPIVEDFRVHLLVDQIRSEDLMNFMAGFTGVTPVVVGGAPQMIPTRFGPTDGCRIAEQYALETLSAAGFETEFEPCLGIQFMDLCLSPDSPDLWCVSLQRWVDHSGDGGATWEAQGQDQERYWAVDSPGQGLVWAVGDNGAIRHSPDRGATWTTQYGPGGAGRSLRGVRFLDPSLGWIVGEGGLVLQTSDGGALWNPQASGVTYRLEDVRFVTPDSGWICGHAALLRTADGGAHWIPADVGPLDLRALAFVDARNGWAVGDQGTILHTTDAGLTWTAQTPPATVLLEGVHFTSPTEGWAVGDLGTLLHTPDAGAHWALAPLAMAHELRAIEFSDPLHGWIVGLGVVLATDDGGATWTERTTRVQGMWRNVVAVHRGTVRPGRQILLTAHLDDTSDNALWNAPGADDNGSGSTALLVGAPFLAFQGFDRTIRVVLFTGEEMFYGSPEYVSNAVFRGDTIDAVVNLDMIGYEGDGVERVEVHAGTDPACGAIADALAAVDSIYGFGLELQKLTTDASSYSDHAAFWDVGYPAVCVSENFWGGDRNPWYHKTGDVMGAIDSSYYARIARCALATVASLAGPNQVLAVRAPRPARLALLRAGPVPTRGAASLWLALPASGEVRAELFDVQGRRFRTLEAGWRSAGTVEVAWDGRNDAGAKAPPGVVFYRVTAAGAALTGRLVVVR